MLASQFTLKASSVSVTGISWYDAVLRLINAKNRVCITNILFQNFTEHQ